MTEKIKVNSNPGSLRSLLFAGLMLGAAAPLRSADVATPIAKPAPQDASVQTGDAAESRTSCYQTQPEGQGAIDAIDWVTQAQVITKAQGKDAASTDYSKVQCYRGTYYTVVYRMDGTCLLPSHDPKAYGANATKEVGTHAVETTDTEGKKYIQEMIETAKTAGAGLKGTAQISRATAATG